MIEKTVKISGLNIVTQPHSPQQYVDIFNYIADNRMYFNIHGSDYLMMTRLKPINEKDWTQGIRGEFLKFTQLPSDTTWIDSEKGDSLDEDEAPNLPSNIHPNGQFFEFIFFPKHKEYSHKLFYAHSFNHNRDAHNLSPRRAEKFFIKAFEEIKRLKAFDLETLEVTVIPSVNALSEVLGLSTIKKLEIVIKAPNPDDFGTLADKIREQMESANTHTFEQTYHGNQSGIIPTSDMKQLSEIAKENGYVKTKGKDTSDKPAEKSTLDQPLNQVEKIHMVNRKDNLKNLIRKLLQNFRIRK